jgi:hypothetical protein
LFDSNKPNFRIAIDRSVKEIKTVLGVKFPKWKKRLILKLPFNLKLNLGGNVRGQIV